MSTKSIYLFSTEYKSLLHTGPYDGCPNIWLYILIYLLFVCSAPVLVALALIESGMEYEDAVHFIRQ